MTRFRTRRMEHADEAQFNDIFNTLVAGRRAPRSLDVMRHIWHDGPGGPVCSWIVETQSEEGEWRIIAHHGLCPIRYTMGSTDFVFAKTVNSFLLPEFRDKFLYLRFEQRCLAEVERLFDATYTLTSAATRIRAALGYDTDVLELDFERGVQPIDILSRLWMRLIWRYPHFPVPHLARLWSTLSVPTKSPLALTELDADAAVSSSFFADFWTEARPTAGLAPRRDVADLAWRFWKMPGARCTTLTHTWPGGVRGYCIVNHHKPFHFVLEDIFLAVPGPELLEQFLSAIFAWCAENGCLMLSFMTTADGQPPGLLEVYRRNMGICMSRQYRNSHMSRRLTLRGRERLGTTWPPCNITPISALA